jgi:hypothetical protein
LLDDKGIASSTDPDTVLDEAVLQITVQPTQTTILLTLQEMVEDAIANLNAQISPIPRGAR